MSEFVSFDPGVTAIKIVFVIAVVIQNGGKFASNSSVNSRAVFHALELC